MMSFSSFVDFYIDCIKNNKQNSNGGYGTLCDFVLDENMNPILDYTGRMESYELNIKEILKKLNVSTNTTIMHSNKGIDKHYLNYFDKKLIASVSEFFKKDLEIFKYQY